MTNPLSRRELVKALGLGAASLALPFPLSAAARDRSIVERLLLAPSDDTDQSRLTEWTSAIRAQSRQLGPMNMGARAVRAGELAVGTPYEAFTLEAYIRSGGSPVGTEPIALS